MVFLALRRGEGGTDMHRDALCRAAASVEGEPQQEKREMSYELADEDLPQTPDFGDEAVRRRLGPSSLKLFTGIIHAWKISKEESRQLLALAPGTNLEDLDPASLGEDHLMRISYLLGIFKALHMVHNDELADCWVGLPNTNAMFAGRTPLEYMIRGGINTLRNVRKLLDARCAGN